MMSTNQTYILGLILIIIILQIDVGLGKDHRCRRPITENCNASESYIKDWENTGWFYDPGLGACLPLYTPEGWHTCTENYYLPRTREICEGLCAEPCTMNNGSMGICLAKTVCNIEFYGRIIFLDSCGSRSLRCCPQIPDSRLEKFSMPPKEGIILKVRRRTQSPSREQPVFYVYDIPVITYADPRKYK